MEEILGIEPQGTYLNLKDFNISEKEMLLIDDLNDEKFKIASENLLQAEEIGFDTEFATTLTKMDPPEEYKVSLLQMADSKMVYIFDIYTLRKNNQDILKLQTMVENILAGKSIKMGVGIANDFK